MIYRYDLLAAVKYPKRVIRGVKSNTCVAVLDRTFLLKSDPHDALYRKILRSKKNLSLLVHACWNKDHKYTEWHLRRAKRAARRLHAIVEELGAWDRFYFSPYLEGIPTQQFADKTFGQLIHAAPGLQWVNSRLKNGSDTTYAITEVHGDAPPPKKRDYIWSSDGWDARKINVPVVKAVHRRARMFALWIPEFNGKDPRKGPNGQDDKTPPRQRKNFPTLKQIREIGELLL